MYVIKPENKKELINGRKLTYLAKELGLTTAYLCSILMGRYKTSEITARGLISIREQIPINDLNMSKLVKYYFKREE